MSENKVKKVVYNEMDRTIVKTLNSLPEGKGTAKEIATAAGLDKIEPGNLVSAMHKNLIKSVGEAEVERPTTRKVETYVFVTEDIAKKADGKEYAYSDTEKAIIAALKGAEKPMTLAELSTAIDKELVSGNINSLVTKKGNIAKAGKVEVEAVTSGIVKVYAVCETLPEGFEA